MFTRWHFLNASGHHPIRSKVHHGMVDVYDREFQASPQDFVKRMRFAIESVGCSPTVSCKILDGVVPEAPDVFNPALEYSDLKKLALSVEDECIPSVGRIIVGMGGTRRLVDVLKRVPAGADVLVGRYGLSPRLQSLTTRLPGEATEEEYFRELQRIGCQHFTMSSRYFTEHDSHAVSRLSYVHGDRMSFSTSDAEHFEDFKVGTDDYARPLLKQGTFLESLKLCWVACNWEKHIPAFANRVRICDLFEKRNYNVKNTSYGARMVHGARDDGVNVEDRMLVHKDCARLVDSAFRSALRKGIRLHYDVAIVNPGKVGDLFETISHRLAIRARTHTVKVHPVSV